MQALIAVSKGMFRVCFAPADVDRLGRSVTLVPENPYEDLPDKITPEWIGERIVDAEILITCWGTPPLTDELIDRAGRLRAIVHSAGSVKRLIPQRVFDRKIAVTNTRHALAVGVAETALGMIIAGSKMFIPLDRDIEKGKWREPPWTQWILEPYDITIGVVAASEVGKHLLKLLEMFEVRRLVYDPYADAGSIAELGAEKVELSALCSASDIIAVCAPATDETRHMIGREQFTMMKDRVRLINTSRGSVIDEEALVEKLSEGNLYAILDVTDPEPPAADSPLRSSPYCSLTPHIAGHAANGRLRQGRLAVDEIRKFLDEGCFEFQVTAESLNRMG